MAVEGGTVTAAKPEAGRRCFCKCLCLERKRRPVRRERQCEIQQGRGAPPTVQPALGGDYRFVGRTFGKTSVKTGAFVFGAVVEVIFSRITFRVHRPAVRPSTCGGVRRHPWPTGGGTFTLLPLLSASFFFVVLRVTLVIGMIGHIGFAL